ncbi:reverse transcriptase domain-containing protein [Tanacetum coccineum]
MVTPADKRSSNKFCEFHNDKGHSTDECMQLKKQIEELVKGESTKVTLSFSHVNKITFPPLSANKGTKGDAKHFTEAWMNFMIVRSPSPYNGIIGRPGIREIQAVPSTAHGMLKFPVNGGVVTICSTILTPNECATIMETSKDSIKKIEGDSQTQTQYPGRIPPSLTKKAGPGSGMSQGHPGRVMVKKHDGSWRMCMDFTNLNKACPQDCYPLSKIDWKVKSLCGYPFKCFMNAYNGYHHIQIEELDEEKMAFHTPHGVYCNIKMPFGLKNTRATYQRLVDKAFEKQVGQNLEVHKTVPREDRSCVATSIPTDNQGGSEPQWEVSWPKQDISELPMLVAPRPKEELIMYLSASQGAVGAILMTKRDSIQTPIYFVSRALQGPELNYTPMEKLVLALVFVAKRLRSIILGEHNITYRPRTSVKGQILADFLVEKPEEALADILYGEEFTYALRFQFTTSNNKAEYEALLVGLRITAQMGVHNVQVSIDSKLVVNQVLGTYIAKEENVIKYLEKVLVEVLQEKSIQEKEVAAVVEEEGPR